MILPLYTNLEEETLLTVYFGYLLQYHQLKSILWKNMYISSKRKMHYCPLKRFKRLVRKMQKCKVLSLLSTMDGTAMKTFKGRINLCSRFIVAWSSYLCACKIENKGAKAGPGSPSRDRSLQRTSTC